MLRQRNPANSEVYKTGRCLFTHEMSESCRYMRRGNSDNGGTKPQRGLLIWTDSSNTDKHPRNSKYDNICIRSINIISAH